MNILKGAGSAAITSQCKYPTPDVLVIYISHAVSTDQEQGLQDSQFHTMVLANIWKQGVQIEVS